MLRSLSHGLRALALVLGVALLTVTAVADPRPLMDPAADDAGIKLTATGGGEGEVVNQDGGKAIAITYGHQPGDYPGVAIAPEEGAWDLSGCSAVRLRITNTSDAQTRVHARVDNPGNWQDKPWSVNAATFNPGQTGEIVVRFGQNYGNPAYKLDPTNVTKILIFGEKPRQPVTLHVTAIEAITDSSAVGSGAGSEKAAATSKPAADEPAIVPASNTLYDFATEFDPALLADNGTTHEVVDSPSGDGKALRVTFTRDKGYPGVQLNAPGGGWDLRARAGIEVDVTNPGDQPISVVLRVDNPGEWKNQPWNYEKANLRAGETKTIRLAFVGAGGSSAHPLNPAKIVRCLIYTERVKPGSTVLVRNLRAWGHAAEREVDTVDLEGVLFDFGPSFIPAGRVAATGAETRVEDGRLVIDYSTESQWPAVALRPIAKRWDLSNFESIQAELTNLGSTPARIGLRVDNPGAPKSSNTEIVILQPGQTQPLKVTFGKSWGAPAYALDPSQITSLLLFPEKLAAPATIAIDNVKANRKQWAEVPEWIGQRPPVEGDWVQTLDENFDGAAIDESLWNRRLVWGGPQPGETQRYIEENVYVEDGKMVIKCEYNPGHQYNEPERPRRDYATGVATTLDKWTQCYGYFEARIKSPTARGLWPAFWTMPDRGEGNGDIWQRRSTSNGGMEIDIWEHLTEWGPHRYNVAVHWDGYGADHKAWGNGHIYHLPTQDGWHNYGLLWEPGKLTWYCDGKPVAAWENERVASVPMYLKLCVQMGNWATKDVDDAALPDFLQVDYVRAWQLRERLTH